MAWNRPLYAHNCDALRSNFVEIFRESLVVEGGTSVQIPRPFGSIALVAALLMGLGVAVPTNAARANDCLTAPNSSAPQGSHWYYRLDRASQRKCWYVRAAGQPVQQAALPAPTPLHSMPAPSGPKPAADGAPVSASPGDITPPLPHVEIHAVKPNAAPVSSATTGNTASSGPQTGTWSETSAQAAAQAPAAPDAPPAVATVKSQEPIAVLSDAPADSVSESAERIAGGDDSTDNAGMPLIIFLILALGLTLVGTLSRDVMKIAAARRERITAARM
jgi:hypothetical protein